MLRPLALAALALATNAGCYCSHLRSPAEDGGAPADAPASIDAPPGFDVPAVDAGPRMGIYWEPVPVPGAEILAERCEQREGQTVILRVRYSINLCDEPGNVRYALDPATGTIVLDPFAWRRVGGPPCPPAITTIERDVALRELSLAAGTYTATLADGSSAVTFDVWSGPAELTCFDCISPGEMCIQDQECIGDATCVPIRGDAVCASICATPCQPFPLPEHASTEGTADLSCRARLGLASTCEEDPNLGWRCALSPLDLCGPCPAGTACSDGDALTFCSWTLSPWAAGGTCVTDTDCEPGLSCVELAGARSCQIRCVGDHSCPMGLCDSNDLVCEIPKI